MVDHGLLAYDGTLTGLAATVDAYRVLVIDLARATPDLIGLPGTTHLGSEADGLQQRLALHGTNGAGVSIPAVLAAVAERGEVRDLSIEEPDIENVVRRIYTAAEHDRSGGSSKNGT